jgi:hypothetical protein
VRGSTRPGPSRFASATAWRVRRRRDSQVVEPGVGCVIRDIVVLPIAPGIR